MSNINFPNTPTVNMIYSYGGKTWKYNGSGWALASNGPIQVIPIACSDEGTALTVGTAKVTFRMPFAFTLVSLRASLTTAQTSGTIFTIDLKQNGSSILSTKLTIDNTEKSSTTSAIPYVLSQVNLLDDDEMVIDIFQIGDGTAKGLKVYLIGSIPNAV